VSVVSSTGD